MLVPKQLAILQFLVTHLEGMTPATVDPATNLPYVDDMTGKVLIGKTTIGSETVPPVLAFLEKPDPAVPVWADNERLTRTEGWGVLLQGFAPDDKKNPTVPAYWFKARVEQRLSRLLETGSNGDPLFPEGVNFARLVTAMTIGQGVVRPPAVNVSPTAFFYLPLVVDMTTDLTNPYVDA